MTNSNTCSTNAPVGMRGQPLAAAPYASGVGAGLPDRGRERHRPTPLIARRRRRPPAAPAGRAGGGPSRRRRPPLRGPGARPRRGRARYWKPRMKSSALRRSTETEACSTPCQASMPTRYATPSPAPASRAFRTRGRGGGEREAAFVEEGPGRRAILPPDEQRGEREDPEQPDRRQEAATATRGGVPGRRRPGGRERAAASRSRRRSCRTPRRAPSR